MQCGLDLFHLIDDGYGYTNTSKDKIVTISRTVFDSALYIFKNCIWFLTTLVVFVSLTKPLYHLSSDFSPKRILIHRLPF